MLKRTVLIFCVQTYRVAGIPIFMLHADSDRGGVVGAGVGDGVGAQRFKSVTSVDPKSEDPVLFAA